MVCFIVSHIPIKSPSNPHENSPSVSSLLPFGASGQGRYGCYVACGHAMGVAWPVAFPFRQSIQDRAKMALQDMEASKFVYHRDVFVGICV
jgi:hypothetical protein